MLVSSQQIAKVKKKKFIVENCRLISDMIKMR